MAGFWGKRKREEQQALAAQDADLARRAESALVAADEKIRLTTDELDFAEAELGTDATSELRTSLASVRHHMGEAFQLHQLNHDEIPDTAEELRTRNARIVQLCEWAEDLIEAKTTVLADKIATARRAPEIIAGVRMDAVRFRERLPQARETVARVAERYSPQALSQIAANPDETEQLLAFAEHSADVSERRRDAGQREQANLALETATEAVRRAGVLLDAVESFEIEALRAESTLAAVVDDSRDDLVIARSAPQVPAVTAAARALEQALAALPPASAKSDPFAELTQLREANTALDAAIAAAQQRAANPLPTVEQIRHAVDDADRQLAVARSVIAGHRGWIGADARTRLAEAERIRLDMEALPGGEDSLEPAFQMARRAALLASEALQLAQRDIDSSRPQDGGWGGGPPQGGRGGMGGMGGILGGLVIGSLLGDIFDG
ncbi:hypothetical protein [Microbacterium rhizomatis]|uniref:TPM domain-containing protein n=1 Tax=Microbacterium rhizomatis TaxID=1631477 RepID=A0A5J5J550_9MICO|nr:hypothetical protein [Microbacterium rhizomatis]KAA9111201.1 hypothetical protein F6B43_06280 [Microbacterium rhizomatis]